MLTLLGYALLALVVAAALYLLAANLLPAGEQIAPPLRDEAPWDLPETRRLTDHDVENVRLPVSLRGYRFAETDLLLDRLAAELRQRDAEIARLRGGASSDETLEVVEPAADTGDVTAADRAADTAADTAEPAAGAADGAAEEPSTAHDW